MFKQQSLDEGNAGERLESETRAPASISAEGRSSVLAQHAASLASSLPDVGVVVLQSEDPGLGSNR